MQFTSDLPFRRAIQNTLSIKKTWTEILRYILGGSSSAVICFGSLAFFVEILKINYLISANMSGGLTYFYSYIINKYMVFKKTENTHFKHGTKFILLQIFLWIASNALLYWGVDILKMYYLLMVILIAAFNALLNFILMKLVVFI